MEQALTAASSLFFMKFFNASLGLVFGEHQREFTRNNDAPIDFFHIWFVYNIYIIYMYVCVCVCVCVCVYTYM